MQTWLLLMKLLRELRMSFSQLSIYCSTLTVIVMWFYKGFLTRAARDRTLLSIKI
jgi:hypothetical protein